MKAMFYTVLFLVGSLSMAHSKTILISDIDDTLKIVHVLDKTEALRNVFRTENIFGGMSSLYRVVKKQDRSIKFFYVSNAPKQIMQGYHKEFLSLHRFPRGTLRLRPNFFDDDFKTIEIREILKKEKPDRVIMVGDNGEHDPEFYAQIQKEHENIRFVTYIHMNYYSQDYEDRGEVLQEGQIGYVTAWDLTLHLRQEGLVSDDATKEFMKIFALEYMQESEDLKLGTVVIPSWLDCRDFQWTAQDQDLSGFAEHALVKEKILERCGHDEIED